MKHYNGKRYVAAGPRKSVGVFTVKKIDPVLYFGYGSLMNKDTLKSMRGNYEVYRGVAVGWVRSWAKTARYAYMNAIYTGDERDMLLGGVISIDTEYDKSSLRGREARYDEKKTEVLHAHPENRSLQCGIFYIDPEDRAFESIIAPCTMSYVLTCAQGMVNLFGERALERYFKDTIGWPPIKDDRALPSYPRASYTDEVQKESLEFISKMEIPIVSKVDKKVIPIKEALETSQKYSSTSYRKGYEYAYGGYDRCYEHDLFWKRSTAKENPKKEEEILKNISTAVIYNK